MKHGKYKLKAGKDSHGSQYDTVFVDADSANLYGVGSFAENLDTRALYYDCGSAGQTFSTFDACRTAITAGTIIDMASETPPRLNVNTITLTQITTAATANLYRVKATTLDPGGALNPDAGGPRAPHAARPEHVLVRLVIHGEPDALNAEVIEEEVVMCPLDEIPDSAGGCSACAAGTHNNDILDEQTCNDNTCSCPGGTVTITGGTGATLCAIDGDVDCSACEEENHLSAGGSSVNTQTCVENTCIAKDEAAWLVLGCVVTDPNANSISGLGAQTAAAGWASCSITCNDVNNDEENYDLVLKEFVVVSVGSVCEGGDGPSPAHGPVVNGAIGLCNVNIAPNGDCLPTCNTNYHITGDTPSECSNNGSSWTQATCTENVCDAKTDSAWNDLGCVVATAAGTTVPGLDSVNPYYAYTSCSITCMNLGVGAGVPFVVVAEQCILTASTEGSCKGGCPAMYYQSEGTNKDSVICTTCEDGHNSVAGPLLSSPESGCLDNVCTCADGTATTSEGGAGDNDAGRCETTNTEDCESCLVTHHLSTSDGLPAAGLQTCDINQCINPTEADANLQYDITYSRVSGNDITAVDFLAQITTYGTNVNALTLSCDQPGKVVPSITPLTIEQSCDFGFRHNFGDVTTDEGNFPYEGCRGDLGVVYGYVTSQGTGSGAPAESNKPTYAGNSDDYIAFDIYGAYALPSGTVIPIGTVITVGGTWCTHTQQTFTTVEASTLEGNFIQVKVTPQVTPFPGVGEPFVTPAPDCVASWGGAPACGDHCVRWTGQLSTNFDETVVNEAENNIQYLTAGSAVCSFLQSKGTLIKSSLC